MTHHLQQYSRAIRHFGISRGLEVLALQASPFLGVILSRAGGRSLNFSQMALLMAGSLALTAHIFVFNDWAGQDADLRDHRRAPRGFSRCGIRGAEVAILAVGLLVIATALFALVSPATVLLGASIASLSTVYSCFFGKGTPIVSSLIHLLGGAFHFLLGYTVAHAIDPRGIAIAIFFGLVFSAGHLNQEVRDHDGDLRNRIRTNAVVFGCHRAFVASLTLFSVAYLMLAALAAIGVLPRLLIWSALLWPLHVAWSLRAIRNGLGFDSACWMQRRYRLLFGVLGLSILLTASPAIQRPAGISRSVIRASPNATVVAEPSIQEKLVSK
jgi:4-hydroxybenzoate polyprenyltransferase